MYLRIYVKILLKEKFMSLF